MADRIGKSPEWEAVKLPEVGETIIGTFPPPPTWFDLLLWRIFRYHRKREPITRTYTCVDTYSSEQRERL